jgi:hypothetical protein
MSADGPGYRGERYGDDGVVQVLATASAEDGDIPTLIASSPALLGLLLIVILPMHKEYTRQGMLTYRTSASFQFTARLKGSRANSKGILAGPRTTSAE